MGSSTYAYDINVSDVRVLEFAPGTTRFHDQMEAIVPHLLAGLRQYANGEQLDKSIVSKLTVFVSRMQDVNLHSSKLDAKLQAQLFGANTLLGNTADAARSLQLNKKYSPAVTNPWTITLNELIIAVVTRDLSCLEHLLFATHSYSSASKLQQLIGEEINYYITEYSVS